jgi:hypothetical protein
LPLSSERSSFSAGAGSGPSGTGQPAILSSSQPSLQDPQRPRLPTPPPLLDSRLMPPPVVPPMGVLSPPRLLLRPRLPCPPRFRHLPQGPGMLPSPPHPFSPRLPQPLFTVRGRSALLHARHLQDRSGGACLWAGALSPKPPQSRDPTQFPHLRSGQTGSSGPPRSGRPGSRSTTPSPGSSTAGLPAGESNSPRPPRLQPQALPGSAQDGAQWSPKKRWLRRVAQESRQKTSPSSQSKKDLILNRIFKRKERPRSFVDSPVSRPPLRPAASVEQHNIVKDKSRGSGNVQNMRVFF